MNAGVVEHDRKRIVSALHEDSPNDLDPVEAAIRVRLAHTICRERANGTIPSDIFEAIIQAARTSGGRANLVQFFCLNQQKEGACLIE